MTIERTIKVPALKRWNSTRMAYDVVQAERIETIVLDIDIDEIARRLGAKAANSKGRKAIEMRGLVKARAV